MNVNFFSQNEMITKFGGHPVNVKLAIHNNLLIRFAVVSIGSQEILSF